MNNLLIVDDELETLEWLVELFKYEASIELDVYSASTARKALELLDQVPFDVVLTDIKMPGMDGITLSKEIKKNWPSCQIVFLTGYREFEDIYNIQRISGAQYLLKSEDDDEILKTVSQAFLRKDYNIIRDGLQVQSEHLLADTKYWMRKVYLDNAIKSGEIEKSKYPAVYFDIDTNEAFLMFLIRFGNDYEHMEMIERHLLVKDLESVMNQLIPSNIILQFHMTDDHNIVTFIQEKSVDLKNRRLKIYNIAFKCLECAIDVFEKQKTISIWAVTSKMHCTWSDFSKKYEKMNYLMNAIIGQPCSAIYEGDNRFIETSADNFDEKTDTQNRIQRMKYYLQLQKKEKYLETLTEMCHKLCRNSSIHDIVALELYVNISTIILEYIKEHKLNEPISFKIGLYKLTNANEHKNWYEASEYLKAVSQVLFEFSEENVNSLSESAINRVEKYITQHISEDLSLARLAEVGGFNASYLSRLYKQTKGMNITEFILAQRIYMARKYLTETSLKINEIADRVGYTSSHSFARAFKGSVGLSPQEYREMKSIQ